MTNHEHGAWHRTVIPASTEATLCALRGFHRYDFDYISDFRLMENRCMLLIINGRGERIRTSDPLVPNQIQPHIEIC